MTTTLTPDRITVTNESDETVFDTDDRLFFATDFITGTHSVPVRSNADLVTTTTNLSTCHADAEVALGVCLLSFTSSSQYAGIPEDKWFNVSGTYLHWTDSRDGTQYYRHNNADRIMALTFYCEGGYLKIREQRVLRNVGFEGTLFSTKAFTLDYRIWCGLFDQ